MGGGSQATEHVERAATIMAEFGGRTGVGSEGEPRRYLWTDAFAVCNYLALERSAAPGGWRDDAVALIRQVHHVLGRHHPEDPRAGWISGLEGDEAERRPTAGGLRIGKPLPERRPHEPLDERLEWDRDGQYYHYLTRWIHALARAADETGDGRLASDALDLARAAHQGFCYASDSGRRLYWKMSTDLSRPLVPSMGQHDPLDGLVATAAAQAVARSAPPDSAGAQPRPSADLSKELRELAELCRGRGWATSDALGIGGLLADAWFLARLAGELPAGAGALLSRALRDAARSLDLVATAGYLDGPAGRRLAFRELGLAIGLAAVERLRALGEEGALAGGDDASRALDGLERHLPLRRRIEEFWLEPAHQAVETWTEHQDINAVMLATSLLPSGYLGAAP